MPLKHLDHTALAATRKVCLAKVHLVLTSFIHTGHEQLGRLPWCTAVEHAGESHQALQQVLAQHWSGYQHLVGKVAAVEGEPPWSHDTRRQEPHNIQPCVDWHPAWTKQLFWRWVTGQEIHPWGPGVYGYPSGPSQRPSPCVCAAGWLQIIPQHKELAPVQWPWDIESICPPDSPHCSRIGMFNALPLPLGDERVATGDPQVFLILFHVLVPCLDAGTKL